MKKRGLTDSELRLLLVFLSALMFAGAYFLSFRKNAELAAEIEAQNEVDQALVEKLESMVERRAEIEAQTAEYHRAIDEIVAKYPSELPTEKAIEIIHDMENYSGAVVNNISFSMENMVADLSTGTGAVSAVAMNTDEAYTEDAYLDGAYLEDTYTEDAYAESAGSQTVPVGVTSVGYRDTLSMSYEAEYSAFKRMISYINDRDDRRTISSITAAYDSATGNISGSLTVNMYYMSNTEREYEIPHITGVTKGVSDIFRSGGGSAAPVAAVVDEEESEEENGEENAEGQEPEEDE